MTTTKRAQIVELVRSAGQEAAEDMLICIGWASTYSQARALITKAQRKD